ncbi:TMPIT-like protein [Citrus sinensis]|uniref:TMPIT-like protein n=1 Tax=Citrus sinensis TaxID=2711 RepID=A0ACB8LMK4_CITSI|nr:TMPIT-like protein [Citrus sinensis]
MDEKRSNCEKVEEEVERVVEEAKELQEAAATLINRTSSEEQSLRQRALSLDSNIRRLRSLLHSSISSTNNLLRFDSKLADKDRTALLFLLFPSTLLILRSWIWDGCLPAFPVQLYQAWLLFLYTGLALRENILRINGSDIRPWWIYHHYCAMLMALVSLTWEIKGQPNCAQKQRGVQLFLQWAMMQGVAMLLQNRYQRQRLYTRIALGKAKRMDVVWGETAGVDGQLWLLCPILFILQGFEAYVGLLLLKTALVGVVPEWQVKENDTMSRLFFLKLRRKASGQWYLLLGIRNPVAGKQYLPHVLP